MPEPVIVATVMRPQGTTGLQTHFRALLRQLQAVGQPCSLVTPYSAPAWQVLPSFAVRLLIDPLHKPAGVWWHREVHGHYLRRALDRRLASGEPCVIYAQCPPAARAALAARRHARQRVVMVVHFNLSQADEWADKGMIARDGPLFRRIRRFEAEVLPRLDGLVSVSGFMRDQLMQRIPTLAGVPQAVVPNFTADPGPPRPLASATRDLVAIGTLEPRKNQSYLLDVMAAAARMGRPCSLTIVGDGPDRLALQRKAMALGLQSQVVFAGFEADAARRIPEHRACIHLARMESFGIVLIESMAAGRPVFSSAAGGMAEVFKDGLEGWVLPLDDAEQAARQLLRHLDDAPRLEQAGQAARQTFLRRYESVAVVDTLRRFLHAPAT